MRNFFYDVKTRPLVMATALFLVLSVIIGSAVTIGAFINLPGTDDNGSVATETTITVAVDDELREALTVEPGDTIAPGSIESVRQELSAECAKFVEPLRELMRKYPTGRHVPPDGIYGAAFREGKRCESEVSAQEWADFYTRELAGWLYAAE